ncbi:MAG TPA: luciferase family protein [Xanthomonadaceae bacterium]
MSPIKTLLLEELRGIEGVEDRPSPVAGGTALFHRGKPFAHFHHDHELDLRLTRKIIQSRGLKHPPGSVHHAGRSPSSAWIEVRFATAADVPGVVELVRLAVAQL